MSLTAVLVTFGVIFLAELPDKTMVASLVLGSRYRPLYVWAGVAAAFTVHVVVAVAAGSAFTLLPDQVVDVITAVLFAVGAVLVLREGRVDDEPPADEQLPAEQHLSGEPERAAHGGTSFWRVAATSFMVVFIAEMGDLTQISTANLAARFGSPLSVGLGAVLALWTVAGLAIAGGRGLLRVLSITLITRIAASAFALLAVISVIEAIRG